MLAINSNMLRFCASHCYVAYKLLLSLSVLILHVRLLLAVFYLG